jgi:thiamine pyrophosphate-dependent acetolactate synthase large subunit-like protein
MGGFGTPYSQELVRSADLVVVWGASLNRWTTMDGTLLSGATVVQVDDDGSAIDRHQAVDFALIGDVTHVSSDLLEHIAPGVRVGYRTDSVAARLADEGRWSAMPFIDRSTELTIDPRLLTVELDRMLPTSRVVATDVGNFAVWPALYFTVPDRDAYCLPLGFQCVGLGVAAGVGLALARPDRSVIVGVGDGGFLMGIADLETAVRERLPVVYVVYDDEAYGAEMHHFDDGQADVSSVTFPPVDIAGIARGYGAEAVTVRQRDDLDSVATWVSGSRERPLVVHAKVTRMPAWMLDHAFAAESKV